MVAKKFTAGALITGFIALILAFSIAPTMLTEVNESSQAIANTGLPLTSLFSSDGIVMLLVVAFILLGALGVLGYKSMKR